MMVADPDQLESDTSVMVAVRLQGSLQSEELVASTSMSIVLHFEVSAGQIQVEVVNVQ